MAPVAGRRDGADAVRPAAEILMPLVHAAALPGVEAEAMADALRHPRGEAAGLEALVRQVEARLPEARWERARGWARSALRTILRDGVHVLLPGMAAYPVALEALADPPLPLFGRGRLELLETPLIAVVGTRKMTPYGRESAHRIATGLARAGVTVVSGLALGVDGTAHRAAGPSRTVAVLGCGVDVVYPKAHAELQAAIGREGLLLSERLPGSPPARHHFPARNRIIAGLSRAVVVVEAPHRSGALSTAAHGREQGRAVFAVPGPIGARTSEGTNALIRDGGTLVTSAREILEWAGLGVPPAGGEDIAPAELEGQALALWRALDLEPRHADDVSARAGLEPRHGLASLLALEIRGYARQVSGLRFTRGRTADATSGYPGA